MADQKTEATVETLVAFAAAWNDHDIEALMSFMTDDCVFAASAGPPPCGTCFEGRAAVRLGYESIWQTFPDAQWNDGNHFVDGDRGVSYWRFTGTKVDGTKVEANGCDIFQFEAGRIRVKDSYRKNVATR